VKEVGGVDGESFLCRNTTPFGSLLLQILHFSIEQQLFPETAVMWIRENHALPLRYLYRTTVEIFMGENIFRFLFIYVHKLNK